MALPAFDSFVGTPGGPLSADWTVVVGTMEIATGDFARSAIAGISYAFWDTDVFNPDQYAEGPVDVSSDSVGGVLARCSAASGGQYYAHSAYVGGTYLGKVVAGGSESVLQDFGGGFTSGQVLRIETEGTTIRCYKDGVQVGTDQTDAALSSGSGGILGYKTSADLKSFAAGNLGAAPSDDDLLFLGVG